MTDLSVDGSFLQSYIDEHHDFLSWLGTDVDALEKAGSSCRSRTTRNSPTPGPTGARIARRSTAGSPRR